MKRAFISYATSDGREVAYRLRAELDSKGVPCFLADAEIGAGINIVQSLEDELRSAPVLIPIVTPHYNDSTWTTLERSAFLFLNSADSLRDIIPVIVGEDTPVPALLAPLRHERVIKLEDLTEVADRIAPRLRSILTQSPAGNFNAFGRKYGVREIIVVENATGAKQYANLGRGAAVYFSQHVQRNFRIGLASANTTYNFIKQIEPFRLQMNAYPVSLNVTPEMTSVLSSYATLIELWNRNPDCIPHSVSTPAFFTNLEERAVLESRADVRATLNHIRNLNMAFYSCGSFGPGSSYDVVQRFINEYLDRNFDPRELEERGACGEINWHPYSIDGEPVDHPLAESVGFLGLEDLRKLAALQDRHMVLIAGGRHKVAPILGALRGRFLNILVTDQATLEAVITLDYR